MQLNDIVTAIQDMRYLSWSKIRKSSGSAGSFLKAYELIDGRKVYYKLSSFDAVNGITGHECINEIIADRLLSMLGIQHLHYSLLHALVTINGREHETWLCSSEDFKQPLKRPSGLSGRPTADFGLFGDSLRKRFLTQKVSDQS